MYPKAILIGIVATLAVFSAAAPIPDSELVQDLADLQGKTPPGSRSSSPARSPSPSRGATGGSPFQGMIDAVTSAGNKISGPEVVNIWPINAGSIPGLKPSTSYAWLEKGNDKAGLAHIMKEHGHEFANRGISQDDIPLLAQEATQHGRIAGYQGKGTGRPIFETDFHGKKEFVGVTLGNNGFVVGMNPSSESAITKKSGKK